MNFGYAIPRRMRFPELKSLYKNGYKVSGVSVAVDML